jgi:hypothetical protein
MPVRPVFPADQTLARLFTPGARLGWTFRDPGRLTAPYPEPEPDPDELRTRVAARAAAAQDSLARARRWLVRPSLFLGLVSFLLAGYAQSRHRTADAALALAAAVVACGSGLGYTARCWYRQVRTAAAEPEQLYRQAVQAWRQRAAAHRRAELARLGQVPEWGSAEPPTRRTDVFGGSFGGWRALLTVHGASILAAQPLLVMDLSGQFASDELTVTARTAGVPAARYVLPGDLDRCGLLTCLSPPEFADALTEAIHAGTPGNGAGTRADRAVDVRVLQQLTAALDGGIVPARLAAAAQCALGHPVPAGLLTARQEALIGGELFPAEYRHQIAPNLVRLEAFLTDLGRYAPGPEAATPSAYYTCLALDAGMRSARGEMLTALAISWLTAQVSASPASAPAVIIAGADEVTRSHLERLSDACERRRVPLTLLFRHLREDSLHMLGGGTAAFMRLGNHAEAEQAAGYIGRRHTFVLSQLTATIGGNQASSWTGTQGYGDSVTATRGWQEFQLGTGNGSRGVSTSRNWSTAQSQSDGTSWSDAAATQRVYEYAVEPAVLQNLPDHALLLTARGPAGPRLRAVECDPAILALPGVSTRPLSARNQGGRRSPALTGAPMVFPGGASGHCHASLYRHEG